MLGCGGRESGSARNPGGDRGRSGRGRQRRGGITLRAPPFFTALPLEHGRSVYFFAVAVFLLSLRVRFFCCRCGGTLFFLLSLRGRVFFAVVAGAFFLLLLLGAFVVAVVAVPGAFLLLSLRFPAVKKTRREAQRQQKKNARWQRRPKNKHSYPGECFFFGCRCGCFLLTLRELGFTHSLAS